MVSRVKSKAPAMNNPNARSRTLAGPSEVEKAVAELQSMRDFGQWNWKALEELSPPARAAFEVMLIEALTTWPRTAQRQLRAALIVNGYDEQCARRVMSDNLPESIRAASLHAFLRPTGDTGPLVLPS
jgi:hypothetical protein